jgi:hypothetical protein
MHFYGLSHEMHHSCAGTFEACEAFFRANNKMCDGYALSHIIHYIYRYLWVFLNVEKGFEALLLILHHVVNVLVYGSNLVMKCYSLEKFQSYFVIGWCCRSWE